MSIQKTDWGQIEWISYTNQKKEPGNGMNVGIVTVNVGAYESPHTHYDEQVLYVLEGEAVCHVDGKEYRMKPGDIFFWPPGVKDDIRNISDVPFRHLMASHPPELEDIMEEEQNENLNTAEYEDEEKRTELLYIALESIRTQFLDEMQYAYAIYDCKGRMIHRSKYFPDYCLGRCSPSVLFGASLCLVSPGGKEKGRQKESYLCRHGMQLYNVPIYFRGLFLGHIKGGFLRHSNEDAPEMFGVYDRPVSAIAANQNLMEKIAKAIRNYCEFYVFQKQIEQQGLQLDYHVQTQKIMEENLRQAEDEMIDLKINNHFLFNTLNSMASLALQDENAELYQSIINLSELFRSNLRTEGKPVRIGAELQYLKSYLQLQGLRYRDALKIEYHVDKTLLDYLMPHNVMQPVVENAFTHAFADQSSKWIYVEIRDENDGIQIVLGNNGKMISSQESKGILLGMKSNSSHGLSIVYQKLGNFFKDGFSFSISSQENKGTFMKISFPKVSQEDEDDNGGNL